MTGPGPRGGFTLLELLVVMAVMAVAFAVTGVALTRTLVDGENGSASPGERLEEARREAVSTARPVVVVPDPAHPEESVLFLPDGRAVGPRVDALTGRREGPR